MEPTIQKFLDDKKEAYLKDKIKANSSVEDKQKIETEASSKFSLKGWLEDSSHRAGQLSYTTHPAKLSHPDAKINHFIAQKEQCSDGLLRSGNAGLAFDVVGNAACLDVHKFLSLKLSNGLSIIDNLVQDKAVVKRLIENTGLSYPLIREAYLKIQQNGNSNHSSTKLKQVYFPISSPTASENNYHVLSLLTSSSILYELKNHISAINFSDKNKEVRKIRDSEKNKKDAEFNRQIHEIKNLTEIGFGGSEPRNISYSNIQNGGIAFLLNSMPPSLVKRKVQPPKFNFYQNTLRFKTKEGEMKEVFDKLNSAVHTPIGRSKIDNMRDAFVREIFYHIHLQAKEVRKVEAGWSLSKTYEKLPQWQKIYLDSAHKELRKDSEKSDDFQQNCIKHSANWIAKTYSEQYKENLGDDEKKHFIEVLSAMQDILL